MPIIFDNKEPILDINKIQEVVNQELLKNAIKLKEDFVEEQRAAGHWVTGNMGRSYWVESGHMEATVGNSADYMDDVRFGHHNYKGDDFITRVINRNQDKIINNIMNAIDRVI